MEVVAPLTRARVRSRRRSYQSLRALGHPMALSSSAPADAVMDRIEWSRLDDASPVAEDPDHAAHVTVVRR
jgi:hypothetical protein